MVCGDYTLDSGEVCDSVNGCELDCSAATFGWDCTDPVLCVESHICGDEYISSAEECEDGNTSDGDGCDSACLEEEGWDHVTTTGVDGHSVTTATEVCGDGKSVGSECEDGDLTDSEGCASDCSGEITGWDCSAVVADLNDC